MNRKSFLLGLAVIAGLVLGMGQAQAKPNFTGDWKMNPAKSEFGPFPPPDKLTMKIDHQDPAVNVKQAQSGAQGDQEFEVKYTTDGKETTNTIGPMEAKSTCKWEGDVLVVTTKLNVQGADLVIAGKWTLSEDGKTMTQAAHITSPQGEVDMKYVLEKQ